MLTGFGLLLVSFLTIISSANVIEEPDFNATQALAEHGIDVSELPLDDVQKRSSGAFCSAAVSFVS